MGGLLWPPSCGSQDGRLHSMLHLPLSFHIPPAQNYPLPQELTSSAPVQEMPHKSLCIVTLPVQTPCIVWYLFGVLSLSVCKELHGWALSLFRLQSYLLSVLCTWQGTPYILNLHWQTGVLTPHWQVFIVFKMNNVMSSKVLIYGLPMHIVPNILLSMVTRLFCLIFC